jgi:hypothetical protein
MSEVLEKDMYGNDILITIEKGVIEMRFVQKHLRPGWGYNYSTWWKQGSFTNKGWSS